MRERPILFNGAMVRAILSGAKTQTRRVVKVGGELPPEWATFAAEGHSLTTAGGYRPSGLFYWSEEQTAGQALKPLRRWPILPAKHPLAGDDYWAECPFGKIGDRLWVRETTHVDRTTSDSAELARYSADRQPVCYPVGTGNGYDGAWQLWWYSRDTCSNIHMPRSACRLVLEITDVRVERLQAISEVDALAEGAMEWAGEQDTPIRCLNTGDERIAFAALWDSTGGDWDANPWVWVISFKRLP
ncbi:hypothetical protein FHR51_002522 [Xanthomonas arboricola]|uniref:hypothetical protein n=1 Tax=Xanthomonas cannabis TaxID=1885674 RepID=UPI00161E9BCA|nr:hypothetical protein [Xanthomonas cannabis]MBB3806370.1 hypothetical protein [Xanthomonas cannabis]